MGKHSLEKEKKHIVIPIVILTIITLMVLTFVFKFIKFHKDEVIQKVDTSISEDMTIEGEKLIIKSNSEYNRIVEYSFENNILKSVKMYEQFEEKKKFDAKKKTYELVNNVAIISVNEEELSIEIEKKDFGSDTGMSYEQIYDKYLVQIIGAYTVL